jgi:hypothetical protein
MDLARAACRAPLTARKKGSGYENGKYGHVYLSYRSSLIRVHWRSVTKTRIWQFYISQDRVELHCKLQEKLHRVTWPLV